MAVDKLFLSMAVAMLAGVGSARADAIGSLRPGYYALEGAACGKKNAAGPGCTKATAGCMKIEAGPAGSLRFELFSPQESGHVCGINGKASADAGKIVYEDKDANGKDWLLEVSPDTDGTVTFRYVNPPEGRAPFCGEHARLDDIIFKAVKQPSVAKTCFEG